MSLNLPDFIVSGNQTVTSRQRARRAAVVLGMPKHKCRFHGICRIEEYPLNKQSVGCDGPDVVPGWLLRPEPNFCVLLMERGRLPKERESYHFSRTRIRLGISQELSAFYRPKNGQRLYLRRGAYSLQLTPDHYLVQLPLGTHSHQETRVAPA